MCLASAPIVVSLSFFSTVEAQTSAPRCSSAIVDLDGDGWGFENGRSCRMSSDYPVCSASAAVDGDWGFENGRSCVVSRSATAPTCSSAAINNGGGWGWENNRSCRYDSSGSSSASGSSSSSNNSSSSSSGSAPTCSANALAHDSRWGWENNQSCRFVDDVQSNAQSSSQSSSSGTASTDANGVPYCTAIATDNGNGWGFENGQSCRWGDVRPGNNNLVLDGAAPPPVSPAVPGFDDRGQPICLTDASDGNADGFGYENNRTCLVVDGVTATSQNPLLNTRWCQPWAEISYDDYVLQNNTWNDSDVWTDDWAQCIALGGSRGNYVAKWAYNWLRRDQGNEYSVKSYPQVYYGRKTKNAQSGTPQKLGLPANINNLPDFKVRYRYSETGSPERNVALESFFHTSCEAEEWNKHFEMMIWVGKPSTKTPGRLVAEARIDGKLWDIYTNPSLGWGYVAFVEKNTSNQGWLDWNKFVDWTRYQGPSHGVWPIGNNTCMGAIEIGTETFWGTGTFTLHEFRVTR